MKASKTLSTLRVASIALGMIVAIGVPTFGQEAPLQNEASAPKPAPAMNEVLRQNIENWALQGRGIPQDWSHHHLVFSNPGTEEDAIANGTHDRWLSIVNDPRYIIQQLKRHAAQGPAAMDISSTEQTAQAAASAGVAATQDPTPAAKSKKSKMKKDWSESLGSGTAATLACQVGALNSSTISGSSTLTVDGVTFHASPPTAASATGTFSGNPINGQTATIGGSEILTASLSTAATASITVGSSFCIAPGQGVDVDGTTFTTNATAGAAGSFNVNSSPTTGETMVIGGVTYTFERTNPLTGATLNQVYVVTGNHSGVAQNLSVAINNGGTCGFTDSNGVCTRNVTANPLVSSSDTSANTTQTLTPRCADNAAISVANSSGGDVTGVNTGAGGAGTNSAPGLTFALNASGTTPASQTLTATNIYNDINGNATTSAIITATNPSSGVVDLTAKTWGAGANGYTLTDTATSGVTLSGFSGGVNGTNTGSSFAIDNVTADGATNLAAAIARNGVAVGVTASSIGSVVTVTATTPGTSGNSIALAKTLANFIWSGADLGGALDGTTSGTSTPPTFAYWSGNTYATSAAVATNIATAVNANPTVSAVITATANSPASGDVTFTADSVGTGGNIYSVAEANFSAFTGAGSLSGGATAMVQPNMYPATYVASLTGASCSDFAVYPTGQAGSSTAANIIAYSNLYTGGCSGTVPSVNWAYNTGAYAVTTSPIISLDGTQIAFIESNGTTASLVLIKWAAETGESATTPLTLTNSGSASAYHSCTPTAIAPCMFTIPFANGQNDTLSAPFYDFSSTDDFLYVGDDGGNLHKFSGVFAGNPGESGNPWVSNLSTNKLSSPVYDSNSAHIFVGDMGGTLHSVTATGSPHGTAALGDAIADGPMVDGSAGSLYAFVTTSTNPLVFDGDNVVFQFSTGFTAYGTPGVVAVGTGGAGLGYYLYAGDFDNVYYESSSPTSGSLYVVGNTGATTGGILYRIPISGGGMTGSTAGPTVTGAVHPWPSPATEFCNNGTSACAVTTGGSCGAGKTCTTSGTDYLFFSVYHSGVGTCTPSSGNGCILSYIISNPAAPVLSGSGNVNAEGNPGCWATGGILPDNSATTTGASQIYFVNLNGAAAGGAGGTPTSSNCAAGTAPTIQATQAQQSNP